MTTHREQVGRTACYLLMIALVTGAAIPAIAQQDANATASATAPPSLEELQARLEALQRELQTQEAALEESKETQHEEIAALEQRRAEVAGHLLDAQITAERNRGRLEALQQQAEQAQQRAEAFEQLAGASAEALRDAVEQLRIHLNEIPGTKAEIEQLQKVAAELRGSHDGQAPPAADAAQRLFSLIDRAHRHGTSVAVRPATIYTADGAREDVRLLSIGNARFAYVTKEGGRVGLALSSPRDASGFRWTEQLSAEQQQQVRDAVAGLAGKQSGWASVPIDPTGSIEPDAIAQKPTLWSRFAAGGAVMYPLAAIALVGLLLIGERVYRLYVINAIDDRTVLQVLQATRQRDFETARNRAASCRGAVGAVLVACLDRRESGQRAMEDGIQEQLLHELPLLQRFMGGIATLAAVAPLLGLLGTVTGIIRTFGVIRAFGNATPSLMAGGISEALVTTATGLVIAVPILICHSILRGRAERVLADAERYAASLLTTLVSGPSTSRSRDSAAERHGSDPRAKQSEEAGVA